MANHNIWIVDNSKLFREGLKMLLGDSPFEIVCEFAQIDLTEADLGSLPKPELILVTLQTPLEPGSEEEIALEQLCASSGDTATVVMSDSMSLTQLKAAMKAGARGYLLKDIAPEALVQSLSLVMLGEKVLPTDLVTILVEGHDLRITNNGDTPAIDLSHRESLILRYLAQGHPNKVIARELGITEGTVKVHIKAVFKKIRARNRTEAAIWALNHGFEQA